MTLEEFYACDMLIFARRITSGSRWRPLALSRAANRKPGDTDPIPHKDVHPVLLRLRDDNPGFRFCGRPIEPIA